MLRKTVLAASITLMTLVAVSGTASAHAVVYPNTAAAGSYQAFALRVPTEKDVPTIKVRVEMPRDFAVSRVRPLPGWAYTVEKTADGKAIAAIVWSGGKILPGEYQDFEFQGKTAASPGKYAFRALQTYEDGETVEWTGPAGAKTPASIVEVKADTASAPTTTPVSAPTGNPWTVAGAYGGLILGAAALWAALRRR